MTARRHHYVPKFLLAGFTDSGTVDGRLHVMDLRSGRSWQSTPNGAAYQHDYYRVEVEGLEPDAFEGELAKIEGRAADVIRGAVSSLEPPSGEGLDDLVRFLAVMASRTPPTVNHLAEFEAKVLRNTMQMQLAHPKGLEKFKEKMRAEGKPVDDLDAKQMLEMLDNSDIRLPSTWTVKRLIEQAEVRYQLLRPRSWSLLVPAQGAGEFVCSDMPAVIHDPTPRPAFYGPSFVAPESEFAMPLARGVLLMGRFEEPSAAYSVGRETVAVMNGRAMMYAGQLYSSGPDLTWWMQGDRIGNVEDLRTAISARSTESGTQGDGPEGEDA